MAEKPFSLRLPIDLRRLVEAEAKRHGQSIGSYIVGACWAQLERHGNDVGAPRGGDGPPKPVLESSSLSAPAKVVDMAALRAICAGTADVPVDGFSAGDRDVSFPAAEIPICGNRWWENGEHWECLMDLGHRELKHGMREMVRKLD